MTKEEERLEEVSAKAKKHAGGSNVLSGNGDLELALEITKNLGVSVGKSTERRLVDSEANSMIYESTRGAT